MKKLIISGGPHSGKTTLLEALKAKFENVYFVPEPATEVINSEYQKERDLKNHIGKFPWNNYPDFGRLVIEKSLELEAEIPSDTDLAVLDRSLIDTIAYAKLNACEFLLPVLEEEIAKANYQAVFFCEMVGDYQQTEHRSETHEEALATHNMLKKTYQTQALDFIDLPAVSVEERMAVFAEYLKAAL